MLERLAALEKRIIELTQQSGQAAAAAGKAADDREDKVKRVAGAIEGEAKASQHAATATARLETNLEATTRAARESGDAHTRAGRETSGFGDVVESLTGRVSGLVSGLAGGAGLMAALQALEQQLQRNIDKTREYMEASLDLQFQSREFSQGERDFVGKMAIFAARPVIETASAYAKWRSRFPELSEQESQEAFMQVMGTSMTTNAPLEKVSDAYAPLRQAEPNAQKAQNILDEAMIAAGESDPAKMAPLFGKYMEIGRKAGKMTTAEAAGAVAASTGLGIGAPEEAVTGLRNATFAIMGQGTPEGKKVLRKAGVDGDNFFKSLEQVQQAVESGRIEGSELEAIGGKEASGFLYAIADREKLRAFLDKVEGVRRAAENPADLTAQKIESHLRDDPMQALNFHIRRKEAEVAVAEATDLDAMQKALVRVTIQARMREENVNAAIQATTLKTYDTLVAADGDPVKAAGLSAPLGRADAYERAARGELDRAVPLPRQIPKGRAGAEPDPWLPSQLPQGGGGPGANPAPPATQPARVSEATPDPVSDQVRDAARSFGDSLNRNFGDPAPAPAPQPAEPMSSAGDDEAVAQVSALMRSRYGFPGGESSRSEGGGGGLGARPIHVTMIANQYNLADPLSQYASPEDLS